jgi:hypothetical protein
VLFEKRARAQKSFICPRASLSEAADLNPHEIVPASTSRSCGPHCAPRVFPLRVRCAELPLDADGK